MPRVDFHVMTSEEWTALQGRGPVSPKHVPLDCGACGKPTNARVVASCLRARDGATVLWCVCACEKEEPVMVLSRGGVPFAQHPEARHYQPAERWPADLAQLYDEAAKAFAAGAYTASTMVARKVLMAVACREGAADGEPFVEYVDYIVTSVLTFPKARAAIDQLRKIGNEANHSLAFVGRDEAKRAMDVVTYMLNTIYDIPPA